MASGLCQHASASIDHDNRYISSRCASNHIAGVLLVARRVCHDELALIGREEAVGHINGDALLALCGQTIDQQREIQLAALRADFLGVRDQCFHLILEEHLGLIQQAPDQRALTVIHAAAGDEAQKAFLLVCLQVFLDIFRDKCRYM